ncbi:hypothetical protein M0R72_19620 [Candidatus Pacearchaeota archaeon]|jgi:hypothetical protein|nr:hypothetical protein [Candidatus Pacearchaeota archaeon]
MIPYPIEEMRKFIVEKYPNNHNTNHPDYTAGALMSAILRWWDDEMQAEIRKKDQEIKRLKSLGMDALDFYIQATEMRHRNMMNVCDMALEAIDYAEDLERQLAEQQAWIGKLEEAWIVADGNILSLHRDHLRPDQVSEEKRLRYRHEAKEALEKLKG